jgi:DNA-directed RNA polymerase specialized sigma24 family protein
VELRLHDVNDASGLCWRVVGESGLRLSWHEREDLHAWLLVAIWELSLRYDPERRRASFSTFATRGLRRSVVDWLRATRGRTVWKFRGRVHERKLPEFIALDDRLVDFEPALQSDSSPGRDALPSWIHHGRGGGAVSDYDLLGLEPPNRTAA